MFGLGKSPIKMMAINVQVFEDALKEGFEKGPELVGAIDQGTSSSRFVLFTPKGQIAASAQMEHNQIFPEGVDKVSFFRTIFFCGRKEQEAYQLDI
jgi:hypothetical protein